MKEWDKGNTFQPTFICRGLNEKLPYLSPYFNYRYNSFPINPQQSKSKKYKVVSCMNLRETYNLFILGISVGQVLTFTTIHEVRNGQDFTSGQYSSQRRLSGHKSQHFQEPRFKSRSLCSKCFTYAIFRYKAKFSYFTVEFFEWYANKSCIMINLLFFMLQKGCMFEFCAINPSVCTLLRCPYK